MMPFENNIIAARDTPTPSLLQQQKGQVKQENTGPTCPGIPGKSCQEMIFLTGSSGQQLPLGSNFGWRVRFYHNKINNNHHLSLATSNPPPSAALQKHHAPFPSLDELFTPHHCCCRFPCLLPRATILFIHRQGLGTFWLLSSISDRQHCQPLLGAGNETIGGSGSRSLMPPSPVPVPPAAPHLNRSGEKMQAKEEEKAPEKD